MRGRAGRGAGSPLSVARWRVGRGTTCTPKKKKKNCTLPNLSRKQNKKFTYLSRKNFHQEDLVKHETLIAQNKSPAGDAGLKNGCSLENESDNQLQYTTKRAVAGSTRPGEDLT